MNTAGLSQEISVVAFSQTTAENSDTAPSYEATVKISAKHMV